jgi:hypothetical protein
MSSWLLTYASAYEVRLVHRVGLRGSGIGSQLITVSLYFMGVRPGYSTKQLFVLKSSQMTL